MKVKGKNIGAFFVIIAALIGLFWFPVKRLIEGDLQETVVISNSKLATGSKVAFRIVVRHRKFKIPVKNAKVSVALSYEDQEKLLGEFHTDDLGTVDGEVVIPSKLPEDVQILLVFKTDSFFGEDRVPVQVSVYDPTQIILSTNKPIYRPGESIRIRSIVRNPQSGVPYNNADVVYQITDPKGNKVCYQSEKSSEFGISSTYFKLAEVVNQGDYKIKVSAGLNASQKQVTVKNYSLPKFKTELIPDQAYFLPTKSISGKLKTKFFFGKPVPDAQVKIFITGFLKDGIKPVVNFSKEEVFSGTTDKKGETKFKFSPHGTGLDSGILLLEVDIEDKAGNRISKDKTVNISSEKICLQLIPEMGQLIPGMENQVYVITKRPDGHPLGCRIKSEGKLFSTGRYGIAVLSVKPGLGVKKLHLEAKRKGWFSAEAELPVDQQSMPLIMRTDKGYYPADSDQDRFARVNLFAGLGIENIYLDVKMGERRVQTKSVRLKAGKATLKIPLDALCGMVTLEAYQLSSHGQRQSVFSRIFVQPSRSAIKVNVKTNKPVYTPGEMAKLKIQLKDQQGEALPGALSINIADEKVLSFAGADFSFLNPALISAEPAVLRNIFRHSYLKPELLQNMAKAAILQIQRPEFSREKLSEMLLKEGLINKQVLDSTEDFLNNIEDLSYLKPEQKEIVKMLSGKVVPDASVVTGGTKNYREQRCWKKLRGWLFGLSIIAGVALFLAYLVLTHKSKFLTILIVLAIIFILAAMLLPALSMARESARKISLTNNLKQIGLSMRMASSVGIDVDKYKQTQKKKKGGDSKLQVRKFFPETLYWQPELVTDDAGQAEINLPMADSITTWQGVFDAIDRQGRLGSTTVPLKVFKDFFIDVNQPQRMTLFDRNTVTVTCHNYLKKPQTISLKVFGSYGIGVISDSDFTVKLGPEELKTVSFRIQANKVGNYTLQVNAKGEKSSDAVREQIRILPSGYKHIKLKQGTLTSRGIKYKLNFPHNAIKNSEEFYLKIYPGVVSEAVDGLEALFKRPYGCFEQTSSTTYPNIMVLQYLKKNGKLTPNTEKSALKYIDDGYQRLLTFEVSGGGFSLYGRSPARIDLTAYGILEFTDMAKVRFVDKKVIQRAAAWLYGKQRPDGSWRSLQETAYITWSLAEASETSNGLVKAFEYLKRPSNRARMSIYDKALVANALLSVNRRSPEGLALVRELEANAVKKDGKVYWDHTGSTITRSSGKYARVETTALALIALRKANAGHILRRKGMLWLTTNKSVYGGWGTTQATCLAIRALLGCRVASQQNIDSVAKVFVNGKMLPAITIKKEASDLMRYVNLNPYLKSGDNDFQASVSDDTEFSYTLTSSYWTLEGPVKPEENKLRVNVLYNRRQVRSGNMLNCGVNIVNGTSQIISNPLVTIGLPSGFLIQLSVFQQLMEQGKIEKFELDQDKVVLYLDKLKPGQQFSFSYRLRAGLPLKILMPAVKVYEYYNPDNSAESNRETISVK